VISEWEKADERIPQFLAGASPSSRLGCIEWGAEANLGLTGITQIRL
jgi:hypothetical protein